MEWAYLGNASHLFSVIVLWQDSEKPWRTLQRIARKSVISLTWPPGYEDRVYRALNGLGILPTLLDGLPTSPRTSFIWRAQKGLQWARVVGSRKYSQLSASGGAAAQISTTTDDLKVLYFWFWNASHNFFTADFPSYRHVAYVIKISWHFPSPQGQGVEG